MAKKMGLGRGLSAILPDVEDVVDSVEHKQDVPVPAGAVIDLPLGDIDPNRNQPRKNFDSEALTALADSIRHSGVLSPILVAREGSRYTIIAGERRWRAARIAGVETIPAIVREWDDIKRQEAALIENMQREDLNPIEEAQGVYVLMNECALTQEEVSQRLGRSRPAVANLLRLLNLPKAIQQAVIDGAISAGHARVLAGIADKKLQALLFSKTVQQGWSVRQLEAAAKQASAAKKEKPQAMPLPAEYEELTERLRSATGLKVSLSGTENKGKIVLEYASQEELQRLWDMLGE
ncbi:MAG: ParB/RepB/Spo0J family partition protein [Clostridia bacterium]|nr:ParB/RepB/Spo0J family partition protein [Clostridia bacterium]